jgi:ABC-type multidrug transport system fused ATPase/permease subunit
MEAARSANAHEFIQSKPDRYGTLVGVPTRRGSGSLSRRDNLPI